MNLFQLSLVQLKNNSTLVKFIYPSSIAVYGMSSLVMKHKAGRVKESTFCDPSTMYGINKLYCENLGKYFSDHFNQLAVDSLHKVVDFRCLRFPGLISAHTMPSGGTSDYGPEMLHYAAQNKPYACFVRPDSKLPFMVMPDAIKSILLLESASENSLKQRIYNVTSFSLTAQEFAERVMRAFPKAEITFEPNAARQRIVDSWPEDVDDSAAKRDWQWKVDYDIERSFSEYLIPAVKKRYNHM